LSVGLGWVGSGLGLENFPQKCQILQSKKVSSVWVKKYQGQKQVGLLFTAGQKDAGVGSGPATLNFGNVGKFKSDELHLSGFFFQSETTNSNVEENVILPGEYK